MLLGQDLLGEQQGQEELRYSHTLRRQNARVFVWLVLLGFVFFLPHPLSLGSFHLSSLLFLQKGKPRQWTGWLEISVLEGKVVERKVY